MYETGSASSHTDLLDKLNTFLTTNGSAYGVSYSGTGDGTLTAYRGGSTSVAETWTLACTAGGATGTFSVTGSVSGYIGDATVGTPFSDTKIAFTLNDGAVDFIIGDTFTLTTAPKWTAMRSSAGSEYIWKAPGNDGLQSIYVGAKVFSNATGQYYNWLLNGFTGFDSGVAFESQSGAIVGAGGNAGIPVLPLWNSTTPYWFVCDGNSVRVVAKVSTVYEWAVLGLVDRYMSPNALEYPVLVGGSMAWEAAPAYTSTNWRWASTLDNNSAFWQGRVSSQTSDREECQLRMRRADGVWQGFTGYHGTTNPTSNSGWKIGHIWPPINGALALRENIDGSYPLFPIILFENVSAGGTRNVYGEIPGIKWVTGYSLAAESQITVGRDTYVVFPNVYRSSRENYAALKLD